MKVMTVLIALSMVFCFGGSAQALLTAVSPTNNVVDGFPLWYQDANGLQLMLCTNPVNCIVTPPVAGNNFSLTIGFGAEMFFYFLENDPLVLGPQVVGGVTDPAAIVRNVLEAAFLSDPLVDPVAAAGDPAPLTQVIFARMNFGPINAGVLQPGATYAVSHPHGSFTFVARPDGGADRVRFEQPIALIPGNFTAVLPTTLIGPFIRSVLPPPGFIGTGLGGEAITGSPIGVHQVTISGPNAGGPGVDQVVATTFVVAGQVFAQLPQPDKIGVFRGGSWFLDRNNNKVWNGLAGGDIQAAFGLATDKPVAGDFNADGTTEIGIFRNGTWIFDNGNRVLEGPPTDRAFTFGLATDIPLVGDWAGSVVPGPKLGVFRGGNWFLDMNGNGIWEGPVIDKQCKFGLATDKPVVGNWATGAVGKDRIGTFRASGTAGAWFLDLNGNCVWDGAVLDQTCNFGLGTDKPVAGDWANTGTSDIGVVRNGVWFLDSFHNCRWDGPGIDIQTTFGTATDTPMVGGW